MGAYPELPGTNSNLEHFQPKWLPLRRRKCANSKELERLSDSFQSESALAASLVAERRHADADVHLQRALTFYRSVGALRYIREGEALLSASA